MCKEKKVNFFLILLTLFSFLIISFNNCSYEDLTYTLKLLLFPEANQTISRSNFSETFDRLPNMEVIFSRQWIVAEAYINDTIPDSITKDLILDIKNDGYYAFLNTDHNGTWEFQADGKEVNCNKGTNFNHILTLHEFSDKRVNATFVSSITGNHIRWIMIPYP